MEEILQNCVSVTTSSDHPEMDYECSMDDDSNFEPMQRSRSNTWPLIQPTHSNDPDSDPLSSKKSTKLDRNPPSDSFVRGVSKTSSMKRRSVRRGNAWGNLTYSELITQAINNSEEKRLTLSQIYDWMIDNVDYFRERRDIASSAGWKNSIRHNLSLHNRFVRVANDSAGQSSYWTVNPEATRGKLRRRATMDPEKMDKIRGRVKRQAAVARVALEKRNNQSIGRSAGGELEAMSARNGFSANGSVSTVHVAHGSTVFRPQVVNCSPSGGTLSAFPTLSYCSIQDQSSVVASDELGALRDQSWMQVNPIISDCAVNQGVQAFEQPVTSYAESNFADGVCDGPIIVRSCMYHKSQMCDCNSTILEIVNSTPLPADPIIFNVSDRRYGFPSRNDEISQGKIMPAQFLRPIQETIVTSSVNPEVEAEPRVNARTLTKSSSLLDDISEVIGRELISEKADVNQVQNSLSTTLHISQNVLYDDDVESWV